jgi:hypothetical protein
MDSNAKARCLLPEVSRSLYETTISDDSTLMTPEFQVHKELWQQRGKGPAEVTILPGFKGQIHA